MPTADDGVFEPDWEAITLNRVRSDQEIPWINDLIEGAAQSGLSASTLEEMAEWRGYRAALITVRDMPGQMVERQQQMELDHKQQEEERERNARRTRSPFGFLRRAPAKS